MKNKKLIRFVESFILLPVMTISMPYGSIHKNDIEVNSIDIQQIVLLQKQNTEALNLFAFNQEIDTEAQILEIKADAIDSYFEEHDMPLVGTGRKMVEEAEKNNLDWRLLPAIAVRESTGGKFKCKKVEHSFFGWGSCKIGFNSNDEAIEVVAKNLGGNNPNTAKHYQGKTTEEILKKYNPPSIVSRYSHQVISIMNSIGEKEIILDSQNNKA